MAHGRKAVDPLVKLSKSLSYLLRHGAEKEGFSLLAGGFLYVDDILKNPRFQRYSLMEIQHVVDNNDKKRFALETDSETGRLKIRANQGHSMEVKGLQLTPIENSDEFPIVIHGTYHKAYKFIEKQGLKRMGRNHIHFAAGEPGEDGVISGMRQSCSVVIYVDLQKALQDGFQFFLSENNVILCPGNEDGILPTSYFSSVVDRHLRKKLKLPSSHPPVPVAQETLLVSDQSRDEASQSFSSGGQAVATVTAEEMAEEFDKGKKRRNKKKNHDS